MNKIVIFLLLALITAETFSQNPRILITTDIGGDPDDQQSLVRLMVYSNEFDIEGIISSAAGTPGELKREIIRPDLVEEIIHGYQKVYPNLLKHDPGFPSPENLLSLVKKGNPHRGWDNVGEGKDTEGSEWIIRAVDKKDKRPLNICIFGGQTDLAQALWKVKKSRSGKGYRAFIAKIRVYDIADQDKIFDKILKEHPGLFYILAAAPQGVDKREAVFRGVYLGGDESITSLAWLKENIIENHGPLGNLYPTKTWTSPNPHGAMKEGDTPSWFFFLKNGLNSAENPSLGGWGGRFILNEKGYFSDATDSFLNVNSPRATVFRWRDDFQRDWGARMDWCVSGVGQVNHKPVAVINGHSGDEPVTIHAKPGKKVTLKAAGSEDPDGEMLSYEWIQYPEDKNIDLAEHLKSNGAEAILFMPQLKSGSCLSIILRVTDSGSPRLTTYRRIMLYN